MAISISIEAANLPPGTAWWVAIWYDETTQWTSDWLAPGGYVNFSNVPETAWLYAIAYDANYNELSSPLPWGSSMMTLQSGPYVADFATRQLVAGSQPPGDGEPPSQVSWPWVGIPLGMMAGSVGVVAVVEALAGRR